MDAETLSLVSLGIAGLSLIASVALGLKNARTADASVEASRRSARAAEESQLIAERQLASAVRAQESALQPYVWADLRPRDDGGMLVLVVGNSGPTVATNVRITFEPSLQSLVPTDRRDVAHRLELRLRSGLRSIAPSRLQTWNLGVAHKFFPNEGEDAVPEVMVTIAYEGPTGPVEQTSYFIALEDLKHQAARAVGTALLEQPLRAIAEALKTRPTI